MGNRHIPPLERKFHKRPPKRKFFLFCEGKKTEPDYFRALKDAYSGALFDIVMISAAGVPETIADKAISEVKARSIRRLDSYEKKDQIWAVFDRDNHPNFNRAVQKCNENRISIAQSNPCFEVWLILHFEDYQRPDDRHAVQKHLESICPDYDRKKRKTTDCNKLIPLIEAAEKRAKKQLDNRESEGDPYGEPSTTVFGLTREIRKAAQ